ncbi:hypothetical protein GQ457_02G005060 [Hibiscus cannabinus]
MNILAGPGCPSFTRSACAAELQLEQLHLLKFFLFFQYGNETASSDTPIQQYLCYRQVYALVCSQQSTLCKKLLLLLPLTQHASSLARDMQMSMQMGLLHINNISREGWIHWHSLPAAITRPQKASFLIFQKNGPLKSTNSIRRNAMCILRSILRILGIHLSSAATSSPDSMTSSSDSATSSLDSVVYHDESSLYHAASEIYIEEYRSRIPTIRFDDLHSREQPEYDCPVCRCSFEPESEIDLLPCNHLFHKECLEKWLRYLRGTCPLCRFPLLY